MLHTLKADAGREKTTSKSVTWRQRCDPCFLERWKHDKKHGKHMKKMTLTHGWTTISRWTEICSTGISSFFALGTKPTPKFNKHWDSHLPHFRDLTALRQIRCSLRNTLVVHDCTKRYFLESLIWIHLEVSINASTPTIVGYVGL